VLGQRIGNSSEVRNAEMNSSRISPPLDCHILPRSLLTHNSVRTGEEAAYFKALPEH
jgi:hypothetical protein